MQFVWRKIRRWYEQSTCDHVWRPIVTRMVGGESHLCRRCEECRLAQELSEEMFYAQFGELLSKAKQWR